jgi:hypothetical protein
MRKITASERLILDKTIFAEPFYTLLDETKLQRGALRDDLMCLLNAGLIEAYDMDKSGQRKTRFCDTDNLEQYAYRATRTGLNSLNASL